MIQCPDHPDVLTPDGPALHQQPVNLVDKFHWNLSHLLTPLLRQAELEALEQVAALQNSTKTHQATVVNCWLARQEKTLYELNGPGVFYTPCLYQTT